VAQTNISLKEGGREAGGQLEKLTVKRGRHWPKTDAGGGGGDFRVTISPPSLATWFVYEGIKMERLRHLGAKIRGNGGKMRVDDEKSWGWGGGGFTFIFQESTVGTILLERRKLLVKAEQKKPGGVRMKFLSEGLKDR